MKNTTNGRQVRKQIVHKIVGRVYLRLESDIDHLTRELNPKQERYVHLVLLRGSLDEAVIPAVHQAREDYDG